MTMPPSTVTGTRRQRPSTQPKAQPKTCKRLLTYLTQRAPRSRQDLTRLVEDLVEACEHATASARCNRVNGKP
jgi:hypothetical protein